MNEKRDINRQEWTKCILLILVLLFLSLTSLSAGSVYADVIIDNGDTGTSSTGTWSVSGGTSPYNSDSLWSRDGATYTWQFDSQPAGLYEVFMWWSERPSRGNDISVDIDYSGGIETISVNQSENAGLWNSLGTYYFDSNGIVTTTAAYGSSVSTSADAVWFKFISDNTPPVAHIDSIIPNPAEPEDPIQFTGHGTDNEGAVISYSWESSIDGSLSDLSTFTNSLLSEGTHIISFQVQDAEGLWSDPVTQVLIVGDVPTEIIIDNQGSETSQTGTWSTSGAAQPYLADSIWSRDGATFTWHFSPPQTGDYEVWLWWTEWPSRSTSVPVIINYDGGSETITVNQQQNGGQWNNLGIFHFNLDSSGSVTVTAQPGPSSTCADAVKFNYIQSNEPPTAIIDSIIPNPADIGELVTLSGHGDDVDGDVAVYSWDSSIDGHLSDEATFSTASLSEGVHTLTFRVQDDKSEWSAPVTAPLTVGETPANAAPTAIIDSIAPNPANISEMVTLIGHGEDTDGVIATYIWESNNDGILSYEESFTTNGLTEGTHTITFMVYDDDGAACEPATLVLTVANLPIEVEIDNGGSGTSYTGTWNVSGATDPFGDSSYWSRDGETYSWEFSPTVSSYYEIFMWWTEWPSRTTAAPVTINHADSTSTVYVNQQVNGGQWNSLGSFYFESDSSYRVSITAQPGPSSTCADAVKFVKTADPGILPPVADFTADRTAAGVLNPIQFYDQSAGTVAECLWDFGDGQTSTQQNPSHEYASEGHYTVSLTATNTSGADTRIRSNYIQIMGAAVENIYLCDGYSPDGLWIPWCENELQKLGAVKNNGVWVYTNPDKGMTYYIHIVRDAEGMERALKEEGAHVIFNGHSNYGLGAFFATSQETREQRIYGVEYVDDGRFLNISTDMVSIKIDGMQSGQAYPDWTPYLSNGESALMPFDFDEGMPAYNYYLTYSVPGDPTVYKVELPDGSFIERFPDSRKPAWDFSLNPLTPDPVENTEYFITNPGDEYNHTEFIGEWSMGGDCYEDGTDCLGYNYHYSAPGSGADIATWYFVVEEAGNYAVEASWESSSSNARNAKYTIFHSGGSTTVEADQTVSTAGGFVLLGEFYFDAGFHMVQLSDDADGTVIADAVHLEPTDNPDDIIKSEFRSRDPISGDAPLTIEFDSRAYASENITDFHYDFGDGNTSDEEDPVHTYSSPGIYTVIHRITDALGRQDTEIKEDFVAVGMDQSLHAEFTQTSRFIELGTSAYFYDQSSGEITARHWDFGDGQTSDEQNPRHTYETIGTYTVTLTVSGPGGSDTETEMDFIYVVLETSYTDNSYQYKSHFVSWSGATSTFGKVVLDASSVTVPEEEFGYSRLFYGSCNSGPYYIGKLHRGIMYFTTDNQDSYNAHRYLRYYLMGYSDSEIISRLPEYYQYYNFNLKPPSMR